MKLTFFKSIKKNNKGRKVSSNLLDHSTQRVILGTSISYTLTRKNIKNLNLRVKSTGQVVLSAPFGASEKYINSFMISKASFIRNALEKFNSSRNVPHGTSSFHDGEIYYFLGNPYTIRLHSSNKSFAKLEDKFFHIYLPDINNIEKKNSLVSAFLSASSKEFFLTLLKNIYPLFSAYQIPFPTLKVRKMRSRWGTCFYTKNSITLNTNLMTKPLPAIEYVIAHELAHFIQPNHSKAFYSILGNVMPDWKERKKLLS